MIQYKCIVEKIDLFYPNIRDDKEYWKDESEYHKSINGKFMRLKLMTTQEQKLINNIDEARMVALLQKAFNKKKVDMAKKLNLGLPATKSRIQRARQLLKAEFITCCHFETDTQGNLISFEIKESCEPLQKIKKQFQK